MGESGGLAGSLGLSRTGATQAGMKEWVKGEDGSNGQRVIDQKRVDLK